MANNAGAEAKSSAIKDIAGEIDTALRMAGKPDRAHHEKGYLKSPLEHYGTAVPVIRKQAMAAWRDHGPLSHQDLLGLVRMLWASPVHEPRMAAVVLLEQRAVDLRSGDLAIVEDMIRGSHTWAYVDGLAAKVAGALFERDDALGPALDRWSKDENFWIRRASMLALLMPLRRGEGDWDRFTRYADEMLHEKEFFIRKSIGWVLRETSKRRPALVRDYVAGRAGRMSGLTFREATKRLPEGDRQALVEARAGEVSA